MIIKRFQWVVGAIAALICIVTLSVAALDNDASAKPATKTRTAAAWKVGDKVSAVWPTDGKWYDARILEIYDTGLYHVRYDDDGIERKDIQAGQIRARKARASTGGGGGGGAASPASCPGPGITRRCGGTCVNLQTDDNNCGGCGNRCSAGKHCDGHLFCRDASGNL